jgi:hypothetical protein|tara:strand:- start:928 stop:1245 length:318 start_codon:yes stop_codon:yes gene_type:complete
MLVQGNFWSETAAGTDSGATATHAANNTNTYVVTSISGHVDADAIITIESPASSILWQSKIDVSVEGFSFNFSGLSVVGAGSGAILGKISASSADCQVNISGHTI